MIWQQQGNDMARVAAVRRLHDVDMDALGVQETALINFCLMDGIRLYTCQKSLSMCVVQKQKKRWIQVGDK